MGKVVIKESQLHDMVQNCLKEAIEKNPELMEGWLGNMLRAGGQTVSNKVGKAYNDFAGRMNKLNADEQGQKADVLSQEYSEMSEQFKQQVREYRSKLMKELNAKVAKYAQKLNGELQKKELKLDTARLKQQSYQDKAMANQQKYDQLHQTTAGREAGQSDEDNVRRMVAEAVNKVFKNIK